MTQGVINLIMLDYGVMPRKLEENNHSPPLL